MVINSAKDLKVYKIAYELAMEIFQKSKEFPKEERYDLTDQIRRSSRSVCMNLREASETQTWLEFAQACKYISADTFKELDAEYEQIIGMLNSMEMNADKFCY